MKTLAFVALLSCAVTMADKVHAGTIVANGDFSDDASSFTTSPGYGDSNGPITYWTTNESSFKPGINSYSPGLHADFAPVGYSSSVSSDPVDFAFLQYVNSTPLLQQKISLDPGATYKLTFVSAPRNGDATANTGAGVSISNSALGLTLATQTYATAPAYTGAGDFMLTTLKFVALGSGTTTITLTGPTGAITGDVFPTEDFSDISLRYVSNTPEPSTYALIGLGVLMFASRKFTKILG